MCVCSISIYTGREGVQDVIQSVLEHMYTCKFMHKYMRNTSKHMNT